MQGKLYLETMRGSEERASIMDLHDDTSGVVVVAKCADYIVGRWPEYAERCTHLLPMYNAYDFDLLMNSTFGLLPAGGSPGTHRLAEASLKKLFAGDSRTTFLVCFSTKIPTLFFSGNSSFQCVSEITF